MATRVERRHALERRYTPTPENPGTVKPGWLTSEFFTTLVAQIGGVVALFNRQLGIDLTSKWAVPFGALAFSLATMAYAFSRSNVKTAAYQAVGRVAMTQTRAEPLFPPDEPVARPDQAFLAESSPHQ